MAETFQQPVRTSKAWQWWVATGLAVWGSLYLLLYSSLLANHQLLIPLRRIFYEQVLEKVFLPKRLPYRVMVREAKLLEDGEVEYGYALLGHFVAIDPTNEILILRDLNGRAWRLQYHPYPAIEGVVYRNLMVSEISIAPDKTATSQITYYLYNKENPEETAPYFQVDDLVQVLWNEARTLPTILADKQGVIPLQGSGKIPIYKIKAK